jgi:hypothetical protein
MSCIDSRLHITLPPFQLTNLGFIFRGGRTIDTSCIGSPFARSSGGSLNRISRSAETLYRDPPLLEESSETFD